MFRYSDLLIVFGIVILPCLIIVLVAELGSFQLAGAYLLGNWVSIGPGVRNEIALGVSTTTDQLVVFSIDNTGQIHHKERSLGGEVWTQGSSIEGHSKQIAVGNDNRNGGGFVLFSVEATSSTPYFKQQFENGSWPSVWTSLGGQSKQIAVGNDKNGTLVAFSIGMDNTPYFKQQFENGSWAHKWLSLGGQSQQLATISSNDIYSPYLISMSRDDAVIYFKYFSAEVNGTSWIPLGGEGKSMDVMESMPTGEPLIISIGKKSGATFEYKISSHPVLLDKAIELEPFFDGELASPDTSATGIAFLNQSDMLLLQKNDGQVRLIRDGTLLREPMLDLSVNSVGEGGLLGIAVKDITSEEEELKVDKNSTKFVFLYLKEALEDGGVPLGNRLYRYEFNGSDLVNPKLLLDLPASFVNHNAGKVKVGEDGTLFVVIGDQNKSGFFQNVNDGPLETVGVILRVDVEGNPLPDNPYFNFTTDRSVKMVFASGIRNSFGLAVDPITGNLWDTENGDTNFDEINMVYPGFNSGWRAIQGPYMDRWDDEKEASMLTHGRYANPLLSWERPIGVTDLEFYSFRSDSTAPPTSLVVGDINNGNLYSFQINSSRTGLVLPSEISSDALIDDIQELESTLIASEFGSGITDIEVGPDGKLYVLTLGGKIFRLSASAL